MPKDIPVYNHCQGCGTALQRRRVQGKTLPVCPNCGLIVFLNPKLAVAVIVEMDGKLLLQRRAIEPGQGEWTFPSGYVDRGEVVEEAAAREVQEETGVQVTIDGLVGLYSERGNSIVLAVYHGRAQGGRPVAGDEVQEVGLFSPDELPLLDFFPHDQRILEDYKQLQRDSPG